jgi:hypothetical protein
MAQSDILWQNEQLTGGDLAVERKQRPRRWLSQATQSGERLGMCRRTADFNGDGSGRQPLARTLVDRQAIWLLIGNNGSRTADWSAQIRLSLGMWMARRTSTAMAKSDILWQNRFGSAAIWLLPNGLNL